MTQICRKLVHVNVKRNLTGQISFFHRIFRLLWKQILICSKGNPFRYRRLPSCSSLATHSIPESGLGSVGASSTYIDLETDADLVVLKISLLGDCQIGKTSFMIKYVGDLEEQSCLQMTGLNLMDKINFIKGARIAFSIWDVGGNPQFLDHVPLACKDASAILIMFDLTSRCTLNSAIGWFHQARKWNQTAIPILIGTKFDDFIHLPLDMQWAIVSQARAYARAMKATLFFSSATHNINVNKIFKFITAKLFNLPWTMERNLTIGEPIIDF
ncbi:ras-related small GTP-binding family protein [Tasmannia lanceolata]|uniref:ras-related small GTP-binding family protein n=1 Tax=Tasmannia lanceolata TaxID=3420 RepID=UPI004062BEAD